MSTFERYKSDPNYRHYKKDSRFISDLYTFTYDDENIDPNSPSSAAVNHFSRTFIPMVLLEQY